MTPIRRAGANDTDAARPQRAPGELAAKIRAVVDGGMWHGPSIREAVDGVSATVAAAHPIEGAHSIWEITLHVGQWAEIVSERVSGRNPPVTDERNFPPVGEVTEERWRAAIERTKHLYHALADVVATLDPATLQERDEDGSGGLAAQIHGAVEHGAYHAGQIVLLRRAAGAWPSA